MGFDVSAISLCASVRAAKESHWGARKASAGGFSPFCTRRSATAESCFDDLRLLVQRCPTRQPIDYSHSQWRGGMKV